jgi:Rieske Fe-S protein
MVTYDPILIVRLGAVNLMSPVARRSLLRAGLGVGVSLALPTIGAGQDDPAAARPQAGDLLVREGDASKTPLAASDVMPGARPILAWALEPGGNVVRSGSRLNQLLLVRLDAESLTAETKARAADGIVAYTAICTHEGCAVDDWLGEEQLLYCPCHGTKYDPKDNARVVEGEAPRPLPALPLKIEDGKLQIAGPLTARVGFQSA